MKTTMEKNAQKTKTKAMIFAVVFHVLLIGGLTYDSNSEDSMLEKVQAYFNGEAASSETVAMHP